MINTSKHLNSKIITGFIIGISALIWCLILFFTGTEFILNWASLKYLPTVLTLDMVLFSLFVKWIWRWRKLQGWLVPFPDLNGTWKGTIKSLWKNLLTEEETDCINMTLLIKQTFLSISCKVNTDESESVSYSASFLIHPETDQTKLIYNYFNKPRLSVRGRSIPHDGTALLSIIRDGEKLKLEGEYWTSRKSMGEIKVERIA